MNQSVKIITAVLALIATGFVMAQVVSDPVDAAYTGRMAAAKTTGKSVCVYELRRPNFDGAVFIGAVVDVSGKCPDRIYVVAVSSAKEEVKP